MAEEIIKVSELLIQEILSESTNDVEINDGFDQTLGNVTVEQELPDKNISLDEFDWDSVSNAEDVVEDDVKSCQNDFPVTSFEETVGSSEAVASMKKAFENEFLWNKRFADKNSAKVEIQDFCKSKNIPFETLRSDKVYLKLVCKHFGRYRNTRGEKNDEKVGKGVLKRPNRKTGKIGCTAFIHIKMDTKDVERHWFVYKRCFDHCHPVSDNRRLYHVNRKLEADDQEFAIKMMQSGRTPSVVLEMLKARDVYNVTVTDLTNIQQRFLSSQKESEDILKRIDDLYHELVSKPSIESALPPATVVSEKERPKTTERETLGIEYVEDAIKQENRRRKADIVDSSPKAK
ncbi:hypothetical protein INT47_011000 [Mucor saturninus]|uniref:FAR1 domain-containing protein n=1 Tax=Mucor saturninus TaxID=64648 RepID=A0A8H7QR64_9FUNG|nr:hypothetical protein INT47_011000 [Mucor saturninus]